MTIYNLEKKYAREDTVVIVESTNKALFNRIDVALDHIFNEFEEKKKKEALMNECV